MSAFDPKRTFAPHCDSKDATGNQCNISKHPMASNRDSYLVFQSLSQAAATIRLRHDPMSLTMQIVMIILLVTLPYGTAIICGALTEWAGKIVSGWCSIGGLALGIYFFSKSMDLLTTALQPVHY
jgi:hypothetical protein